MKLLISLLTLILLYGCNPPSVKPPTSEPIPSTPTPEPDKTELPYSQVDQYYNKTELNKKRSATHKTDSCVEKVTTFAESIDKAVEAHLDPYKNEVAWLYWAYNVPKDLSKHIPTSLSSHPLCEGYTSSNLTDVLKKIPSQSVIDKMNKFSSLSNTYREKEDKTDFKNLWKKLFSCLAYTESLTTADTSKSYQVAKIFNYDKPLGVKFYDDPYQSEVSRYNIGLFQFTPTASGNVQPCLRNWNYQFDCDISTKASQSELVKVFGSGQQFFNAYCGVNKVVGSFAIQQNSSSMTRVFKADESKSVGNRCVSPFFFSGWAYNHFGPLQNSTGSNLDKLLTCVLK